MEERFLASGVRFLESMQSHGASLASVHESALDSDPPDAVLVSINDSYANIARAIRLKAPLVIYSTHAPQIPHGLTRSQVLLLRTFHRRIALAYGTDAGASTRAFYRRIGINYLHLPHSTDPAVMFPEASEAKRFDWCFVGTPDRYRHSILEQIVSRAPNLRHAIVGTNWKLPGSVSAQIPWGPQLRRLYSQSRVCLNLHTSYQQDRRIQHANQRVFDVASNGALQVSDNPETVLSFFPPEQTFLRAGGNANEIFERLTEALEVAAQPAIRELAARSSRHEVLRAHSHDIRAGQLIAAIRTSLGFSV